MSKKTQCYCRKTFSSLFMHIWHEEPYFYSLQTDRWKTPNLHIFFCNISQVCIKFIWQLDLTIARFEREGSLAGKKIKSNYTCWAGNTESLLAVHLTTMTSRKLTSTHTRTNTHKTATCSRLRLDTHHPSSYIWDKIVPISIKSINCFTKSRFQKEISTTVYSVFYISFYLSDWVWIFFWFSFLSNIAILPTNIPLMPLLERSGVVWYWCA